MPRLTQSVPRYRKHRQSGQAIVTIGGKDHLLGPHGTKASLLEYDRLVGEWLLDGRPAPKTVVAAADGTAGDWAILTVVECIARYWQHAKRYTGDTPIACGRSTFILNLTRPAEVASRGASVVVAYLQPQPPVAPL